MKEKLLTIINHYEKNIQLTVAIEEMSELIKELCKIQRYGEITGNTVPEIADVEICLNELKLMFDISENEIEYWKEIKIKRELERIQNECNN